MSDTGEPVEAWYEVGYTVVQRRLLQVKCDGENTPVNAAAAHAEDHYVPNLSIADAETPLILGFTSEETDGPVFYANSAFGSKRAWLDRMITELTQQRDALEQEEKHG